jgi:hypothetical protein
MSGGGGHAQNCKLSLRVNVSTCDTSHVTGLYKFPTLRAQFVCGIFVLSSHVGLVVKMKLALGQRRRKKIKAVAFRPQAKYTGRKAAAVGYVNTNFRGGKEVSRGQRNAPYEG